MKKGEIYEGIVEKIEFPNKGILHIEDEKVIVKNALPGQKIQFLVNKKEKRQVRGTPDAGPGAVRNRDSGDSMSSFWDMRRLSLSDDSL